MADLPLVVPGDELFPAWVLSDPVQEKTLGSGLRPCPTAPRYLLPLLLMSAPSLLELQVLALQVPDRQEPG